MDFSRIVIGCRFNPRSIKSAMKYRSILERMGDAELDWLCEQSPDSPIWLQQQFARGPAHLQSDLK